ncbi:hypothetical protein [Nonomuraea jiangxiensis]|uniref:pPIWI-RE three-gene island domain-containing protein n=1 Tax=Nonomuraea jiangxiensis TaxID=633440 RepID=A0A1G8TCK5_9ACTN|nr:hypothetical protein [Nonomuraea jiangxiensis]SDJ39309.1 hypothetical protein SAMN05421869_110144 [Nonomuraea jiangxiensis]
MTDDPFPSSAPTAFDHATGEAYDEAESRRIIGMVAATVAQLADWPKEEAFSVPYPPLAQRVLDRIALIGVLRHPGGFHLTPYREHLSCPRTLADLMALCWSSPIDAWPFLSLPDGEDLTGLLVELDPIRPSKLCLRLALKFAHPDAHDRSLERLALLEARSLYEESGYPGGFPELREWLIAHPVLSSQEIAFLKLERIGGVQVTDELINILYLRVHERYFSLTDEIAVCGHCGLVLVPVRGGSGEGWQCETTQCRSRRNVLVGAVRHVAENLHHAARPIREFVIAGPRLRASEDSSRQAPSPLRDVEC